MTSTEPPRTEPEEHLFVTFRADQFLPFHYVHFINCSPANVRAWMDSMVGFNWFRMATTRANLPEAQTCVRTVTAAEMDAWRETQP